MNRVYSFSYIIPHTLLWASSVSQLACVAVFGASFVVAFLGITLGVCAYRFGTFSRKNHLASITAAGFQLILSPMGIIAMVADGLYIWDRTPTLNTIIVINWTLIALSISLLLSLLTPQAWLNSSTSRVEFAEPQ